MLPDLLCVILSVRVFCAASLHKAFYANAWKGREVGSPCLDFPYTHGRAEGPRTEPYRRKYISWIQVFQMLLIMYFFDKSGRDWTYFGMMLFCCFFPYCKRLSIHVCNPGNPRHVDIPVEQSPFSCSLQEALLCSLDTPIKSIYKAEAQWNVYLIQIFFSSSLFHYFFWLFILKKNRTFALFFWYN